MKRLLSVLLAFALTTPTGWAADGPGPSQDESITHLELRLGSLKNASTSGREGLSGVSLAAGGALALGSIVSLTSSTTRGAPTAALAVFGAIFGGLGVYGLFTTTATEDLHASYSLMPQGTSEEREKKIATGAESLRKLASKDRAFRQTIGWTYVGLGALLSVFAVLPYDSSFYGKDASAFRILAATEASFIVGAGIVLLLVHMPAERESDAYDAWKARVSVAPAPNGAQLGLTLAF